jgi:hypothetical protein
MADSWSITGGLAFGGVVPALVDTEIRRLKQLVSGNCHGPYDEKGIKIGIGFAVDGRNQYKPIKRGGVRLEPFKNNVVCAGVYVREVDWDVPIESFRVFLWTNAAKAIWTCVERLKRDQIQVDESKLKQQLSIVESEFLGSALKPEESATLAEVATAPLNESEDDEEQRVVIQYQRDDENDPWDFDRKVAFENLLNESLSQDDLGFCDCVEFDFGTINAICSVKNAKKATKAIIQTLRANARLDGAVIEETVKGKRKVVWPEGFVGGIDYI